MKESLKKKINNLPFKPGIYFFKNKQGKIIYIGKSVSLRKRVKSYFQKLNLPGLTQKMIMAIADVEVRVCESEFEALLLEAEFINKLQPYFNIRFKDDKHFLMIAISQDEDYPRIYTTRKKEGKAFYFGPFPSSADVKRVLKTVRRIFPYCTCKPRLGQKKACLYYHLGLCPGCCIGLDKKEYKKTVKKIIKFLQGNIKGVKSQLKKEMIQASKLLEFEKANSLKKQLEAIDYIVLNWQSLDDNSLTNLLSSDQKEQILVEAKKIFPQLKSLNRVEAYDISNLYGQQATGSMVVFSYLSPDKSEYRHFKIRSVNQPDDVAMMKEVLQRRFNRQDWFYPQLVIVDGGKGQVMAALDVLIEKKLDKINLLGLAKKQETIFVPNVKKGIVFSWQEVKLEKNSPFLRFLQSLRDESHRFAKNYHLLLRKKSLKLVK